MKKSQARKIFKDAIKNTNIEYTSIGFEYRPNAVICTIKAVHNFTAPTAFAHGTFKDLYNQIHNHVFSNFESEIFNKVQQSLVVRRATNMSLVCSFKVPIEEEIKKAQEEKLEALGFVESMGAIVPKQEQLNDWLTQ